MRAALAFLFFVSALGAQTSDSQKTQTQDQAQPGTSNTSILPGLGTVPALREKRPSPRDPRYVPPINLPNMKEPTNPAALFLFSGDLDAQKFMQSRNKEKKATRYDEALYDEFPVGGEERFLRERDMMRQFGVDQIPYGREKPEESESALRRFQIVFFISLPVTAAASYGLFRAIHGPGGFTRGQTIGVFALAGGLSTGIGLYDHSQNQKMQAFRDSASLAFTFRF